MFVVVLGVTITYCFGCRFLYVFVVLRIKGWELVVCEFRLALGGRKHMFKTYGIVTSGIMAIVNM